MHGSTRYKYLSQVQKNYIKINIEWAGVPVLIKAKLKKVLVNAKFKGFFGASREALSTFNSCSRRSYYTLIWVIKF